MKKFKNGFLALALVTGISGGVITNLHAAPKVDDPTYNWSGSGPSGSGSLTGKTVAQARTFYGCNTGAMLCATGVDPNQELPDAHIQKAP